MFLNMNFRICSTEPDVGSCLVNCVATVQRARIGSARPNRRWPRPRDVKLCDENLQA